MNDARKMSVNCYKLGLPLNVIATAASVDVEVVTGWIKEFTKRDAGERMARLFKWLFLNEGKMYHFKL